MNNKESFDDNIKQNAQELFELNKNIILIFAFNGTGKTRLSVEYKNITKQHNNDEHSGVYYNAYSEDLFYWDNDVKNKGEGIRLKIIPSSLNQFHSSIDENKVYEKLTMYKPSFNFHFNFFENISEGIESVQFCIKPENSTVSQEAIKISRGEEQIFIWCFFLALFDIQGWTGSQNTHFFIDDPVSSLDDNNIFITAASVMDLIDEHCKTRKIIITTHHIGFFSILADWLRKGEKATKYQKLIQLYILKKDTDNVRLVNNNKDVFLYHLELLQILYNAVRNEKLYAYHFALLRQVLENIGSFLGSGRISYVLEEIGITDVDDTARIINTLSHKTVFRYEAKEMVPDNIVLFKDIFNKLLNRYHFIIHAGEKNG